ncbi:MAG: DNA-formamidopyrimidine glycosylase [Spirulinaceae cyanobacterium SM2_1_0]|nr:DNA-formamidopyrimidine glycosylase [Spirulinaceae cyanobacterium SM2_1_0]
MPELPEVETVRRGLAALTTSQTIQGGEVPLERSLAHPVSAAAFLAGLADCQITTWQRRGKYLLAPLRRDNMEAGWLGAHLRMTGQLLWLERDVPLQLHTRARLFFAAQKELRFVDPRTFGRLWWVPPGQPVETIMTGLQKLGPEPFATEFTPAYLSDRLRRTRRPLKTALLDQALVAGLGNIYADEVLFISGLPPTQPANSIDAAQIQRLHAAIQQVLTTAIAKGGTTFSNFLDLLGVDGHYGDAAYVYGRTGEPCRVCGTPIERCRLAGRSSHFCPRCQT